LEYFETSAISKNKTKGLKNLTPELTNKYLSSTQGQRTEYKCFNMRLNKIVENNNVQIDETSLRKAKEERKDTREKEGEEDLKEKVEKIKAKQEEEKREVEQEDDDQ
jgi:hypothetical protein